MADIGRIVERHQERDRLITLIAGAGIVLGFVLLVLGISGSITLQAEVKSVSGKLVNASPGAVFGVVGFVMLGIQAWKRPRITIRDLAAGGMEVQLHESGPFSYSREAWASALTGHTTGTLGEIIGMAIRSTR
jgi:hypothetical protein